MKSESPKYKLDSIDWVKIGKGLLIALTAALLTYFTKIIGLIEFGMWTPVVMSVWSAIVNAVRKWIANN